MIEVSKMTKEERKVYNDEKAEYRKTNEFFKETASKRTENVINSLNILGFMGKYNYEPKQIEQIFNAVDKAVSDMKNKFSDKKNEDRKSFQIE